MIATNRALAFRDTPYEKTISILGDLPEARHKIDARASMTAAVKGGLTMPRSGADSRTAAGTFSLWPALVIVVCVAATLLWTGQLARLMLQSKVSALF